MLQFMEAYWINFHSDSPLISFEIWKSQSHLHTTENMLQQSTVCTILGVTNLLIGYYIFRNRLFLWLETQILNEAIVLRDFGISAIARQLLQQSYLAISPPSSLASSLVPTSEVGTCRDYRYIWTTDCPFSFQRLRGLQPHLSHQVPGAADGSGVQFN